MSAESRPLPTKHRDFFINEKVWFIIDGKKIYGHISGVSSLGANYLYIITLNKDSPLDILAYGEQGKNIKTVTVRGDELKSKNDVMV